MPESVVVQGSYSTGLTGSIGVLASSSLSGPVISTQIGGTEAGMSGIAGMPQVTVSVTASGSFVSTMAAVVSGSLSSPNPGALVRGIDLFPTPSPITETMFSMSTDAVPRLWLDASKRRSRSQIYIEIVELLTRGPMTPFEIAFYARLNHKRTKRYLEFLKSSGYLELLEEDGRKSYAITPSGMAFVQRVRALFQVDRSSTAIRPSGFG